MAQGLVRELRLGDLVLFNIAAVVSIRWLSTAARIGPGAAGLWAGAAALFFVPLALAVAGLNDIYPEEGGIYVWTGRSFGAWHGFLCGWCYWLSNLFYFPNLLVAGVGISLFSLGERYANDAILNTGGALGILWVALGLNVVGLRLGKWVGNAGAAATCLAGLAVVAAGWVALGRDGGLARMNPWPKWNWETVNYWPQIAFAFGGLELGAILSGEIRDPRRTVRRAAWISAGVITAFYIAGTVAILGLVPPERINIITGLAQTAEAAAARFGLPWLTPLLAGLVAVGIAGQFGAWVGGSARLAFTIGVDRYLPEAFGRLHAKWHTPHVALLAQGATCTAFVLLMQAGEGLRAAYQLLVDMTVITYFIPFAYLFAAAWKHGQRTSAAAGMAVTAAGIAFSFVPPAEVGTVWSFEAKLAGSCAVLIGTGRYFYVRARRGRR